VFSCLRKGGSNLKSRIRKLDSHSNQWLWGTDNNVMAAREEGFLAARQQGDEGGWRRRGFVCEWPMLMVAWERRAPSKDAAKRGGKQGRGREMIKKEFSKDGRRKS
jgi:hypothetical protein